MLLEVNCETDFVARGDKFKELVADLAMQVRPALRRPQFSPGLSSVCGSVSAPHRLHCVHQASLPHSANVSADCQLQGAALSISGHQDPMPWC